jgi:hypothetical protein
LIDSNQVASEDSATLAAIDRRFSYQFGAVGPVEQDVSRLKRIFCNFLTVLAVIRTCLGKWAAALANDASLELNEKLADLNRRSLLRKLELLAARWNVPLDGIDPASLKAAKQARDKVVHRGQYYEDAKETDADLWTHVTIHQGSGRPFPIHGDWL